MCVCIYFLPHLYLRFFCFIYWFCQWLFHETDEIIACNGEITQKEQTKKKRTHQSFEYGIMCVNLSNDKAYSVRTSILKMLCKFAITTVNKYKHMVSHNVLLQIASWFFVYSVMMIPYARYGVFFFFLRSLMLSNYDLFISQIKTDSCFQCTPEWYTHNIHPSIDSNW